MDRYRVIPRHRNAPAVRGAEPNMNALHPVDVSIIVAYLIFILILGAWFTRRASRDIGSFFVSDRALPWYLSGISLIATSFASDTPLWITNLVRTYGVHYVWQYWAPAIGGVLAMVLFARLWRRIGVTTDIEMMELRYSGGPAAALRLWTALTTAVLFCPLIIGWVTKAMETISVVAMGIPEDKRFLATMFVVGVALIYCSLSGLWGVVYTDLIQFILALIGTVSLAVISVKTVGGLDAMVEQLRGAADWAGNDLGLLPDVGNRPTQMSPWNFIGFFGILWIHVAYSGGFQGQRLLACKNPRHASLAMLLMSVLYFGVVCWPWIVVGLCSVILLPDLVNHDAAYPHMIVNLLPVGLKGILLVAMLSAFMSTISTMLNWGSSYLVNDVYKRFIRRDATAHHYVTVGRWTTIYIAIAGGTIAYFADHILQLVYIAFALWGPLAVIGVMRWFWWRMNAWGELVASIGAWVVAALMIFVKIFDAPARHLFGLEVDLSTDPNLVGARMLVIVITVVVLNIVVSLCTRPTNEKTLEKFLLLARPFHFFWRPVIQRMDANYREAEPLGRTIVSWILALICVWALLLGIGGLLLDQVVLGVGCLVGFGITLWLTLRRIGQDFKDEV